MSSDTLGLLIRRHLHVMVSCRPLKLQTVTSQLLLLLMPFDLLMADIITRAYGLAHEKGFFLVLVQELLMNRG